MIVCDTNVVSEPMKGASADPNVVAWFNARSPLELFLPTIVLAEIHAGLSAAPSGRKAAALRAELSALLEGVFFKRILPFDQKAAEHFGVLYSQARAAGRRVDDFADLAIAAVSRAHGFAVATRDTAPFAAAGLTVINPWEGAGG